MKLAIASVYTNFTSEIAEKHGMEQAEGLTADPVGGRVALQFSICSC